MAEPSAPLWRRFAALIYDSFILLALSMLYGALTSAIHVAVNGSSPQDYTPMMGGPIFQAGWALTLAGFYIFFWHRAGQTVGMRAWRLKVLSTNGNRLGLQQCIIRAVLAPISFAIFGLGYFWAWIDPHNDCAHDRLSSTRVVLTPKRKKRKKHAIGNA